MTALVAFVYLPSSETLKHATSVALTYNDYSCVSGFLYFPCILYLIHVLLIDFIAIITVRFTNSILAYSFSYIAT